MPMPLLHFPPVRAPLLRSLPRPSLSHERTTTSTVTATATFLLKTSTLDCHPLSLPLRRRGTPCAPAATDGDILQYLVNQSDGSEGSDNQLPAVRIYQTDLARLTLVGAVDSDQALTAAAADGGSAADEHLSAGAATMVIETVFPGGAGEHSTVSTRLFLPAKKVKEKARKLRSSLTADILSGGSSVSKNILAMTFRQVTLHRLWSFELSLFCPGTERSMEHLANPEEIPGDTTVSSSEERFLSLLADVICSCALASTHIHYLPPNSTFSQVRKREKTVLADSAIHVCRLPDDEIVKSASKQVNKFSMAKEKVIASERKSKSCWWTPPTYSQLDKVERPGFSAWVNEYIPSYSIQVDADRFKDAKFEGWMKLADNRWEVFLTHFQMVQLADILDMYYEDEHTIPLKELSCGLTTGLSSISSHKKFSGKILFAALAGGCILISLTILAQLCWPHLLKARKDSEQLALSSADSDCYQLRSLGAEEIEASCVSVVKKIKDELSWPGDVVVQENVGAWTGMLPSYLKDKNVDAITQADFAISLSSTTESTALQKTAQDIASYEVVLSTDRKIIGFQPKNRVAVNHWASNPITRLLYDGRKLSPGILEPGLKIPCPSGIVVIELLMSVNPESMFAFARPMQSKL